jgi:hypothetical protein
MLSPDVQLTARVHCVKWYHRMHVISHHKVDKHVPAQRHALITCPNIYRDTCNLHILNTCGETLKGIACVLARRITC